MNLYIFTAPSLLILLLGILQVHACPPPEQSMPPLRLAGTPAAELWGQHFTPDTGTGDNETSVTDLRPRWARVPKSSSQWWPKAKIIYCYEGDAGQTLDYDLRSAWDLWQLAGVPKRFVFKQGTDDYCEKTNKTEYLTVKLSDDEKLLTSLGKVSGGSTMILSPSTNIGMEEPMLNYAHEIGHAWGLMHEHQRPDQWSNLYGGTASEDKFIWNCQNLEDYSAKVATQSEAVQDTLCTKRASAQAHNFSALNYLPVLSTQTEVSGEVDYHSIMMYPSVSGGIRTGSTRATVYTFANGSTIEYNKVPTVNDVDNLIAMYPATTLDKITCFYYQACSQLQTSFESIAGCMVASDSDS